MFLAETRKRKIHKLSDDTVHSIRSEVVISSYADIVRELLFNSADSNSKNISLECSAAEGFVSVLDDGDGIGPDDLEIVGSANCTSKSQDWNHKKTFGFKGEALYLIKNVADVIIISKRRELKGKYFIEFSNSNKKSGKPQLVTDQHQLVPNFIPRNYEDMKNGTLVIVFNIFKNLPVRKKFILGMSSTQSLTKIQHSLLNISVNCPAVNIFTSCHFENTNKKSSIGTVIGSDTNSAANRILKSLSTVYDLKFDSEFYQPVEAKFKSYKVGGFICKIPTITNSKQYLVLNNKLIENPNLLKEINKIFDGLNFGLNQDLFLLASNVKNTHLVSPKKKSIKKTSKRAKFPIFVFDITAPELLASNNLHIDGYNYLIEPHLDIIKPILFKIVEQFLSEENAVKELNNKNATQAAHECSNFTKKTVKSNLGTQQLKLQEAEMVKDIPSDRLHCCNHKRYPIVGDLNAEESVCRTAEYTLKDITLTKDQLANIKVINQVSDKFIFVKISTPNPQLYIIDQHACDERIRVEQLLKDYISRALDPFDDLAVELPEKFKYILLLDEIEMENAVKFRAQLERWGIKYEIVPPLSSETAYYRLRITHSPLLLQNKQDFETHIKEGLINYWQDLANKLKSKEIYEQNWWLNVRSIPTLILDQINSAACRSSIMFGTRLSRDECHHLVHQLCKCEIPFRCAHGRPLIMPLYDLSNFHQH